MEMLKQGSITASLRGHFDIGGPFLGFSSMLTPVWKIARPYSILTHQQFQHEIAMSLVQDPAGNGRRRLPS